MPVGIPDTSCLIHLNRIGRHDLLDGLYDEIRIPPAVRTEFGGLPDGMSLDSPERSFLLPRLRSTLDAGESEVIVLTLETEGAEAVLDDRAARREARNFGVKVVDTVGIVLRAKRSGLISQAAPVLEALSDHGFWMSNQLIEHALRRAGEG